MKKESTAKMGPIEAVNYLKKMGEHQTILKNDTDTLIKWAIFLKKWEEKKQNLSSKNKKK